MGKATGFIEIQRQKQPYRPVAERLHDWYEVYLPYADADLRSQASRCMDCGVPFCHSGCPVNNIIPDWNDLVYRDHWRDAIDRLHTTAESHRRILVVEVMGRYAGWIALNSGVSGDAHAILIPEIPFHIERVATRLLERESTADILA